MAKKKLPKTGDDLNQRRDKLFEILSAESDRGLVLVSASFLDEILEMLLRAHFGYQKHKVKVAINPLFSTLGSLSTYSAKIRLSYALNLIEDWVYNDLEIIRQIRNSFAHDVVHANFGDPEVFRLTERLKGADHAVTAMTENGKKSLNETADIQKKSSNHREEKNELLNKKQPMERLRLAMAVSYIGGLLHGRLVSPQKGNTLLLKHFDALGEAEND